MSNTMFAHVLGQVLNNCNDQADASALDDAFLEEKVGAESSTLDRR